MSTIASIEVKISADTASLERSLAVSSAALKKFATSTTSTASIVKRGNEEMSKSYTAMAANAVAASKGAETAAKSIREVRTAAAEAAPAVSAAAVSVGDVGDELSGLGARATAAAGALQATDDALSDTAKDATVAGDSFGFLAEEEGFATGNSVNLYAAFRRIAEIVPKTAVEALAAADSFGFLGEEESHAAGSSVNLISALRMTEEAATKAAADATLAGESFGFLGDEATYAAGNSVNLLVGLKAVQGVVPPTAVETGLLAEDFGFLGDKMTYAAGNSVNLLAALKATEEAEAKSGVEVAILAAEIDHAGREAEAAVPRLLAFTAALGAARHAGLGIGLGPRAGRILGAVALFNQFFPLTTIVAAAVPAIASLAGVAAALGAVAAGAIIVGVRFSNLLPSSNRLALALATVQQHLFMAAQTLYASPGVQTGLSTLTDIIDTTITQAVPILEGFLTSLTHVGKSFADAFLSTANGASIFQQWGAIIQTFVSTAGGGLLHLLVALQPAAQALVLGIGSVIHAFAGSAIFSSGLVELTTTTIQKFFQVLSELVPILEKFSTTMDSVGIAILDFILNLMPAISAAFVTFGEIEKVIAAVVVSLGTVIGWLLKIPVVGPVIQTILGIAGAFLLLIWTLNKLKLGWVITIFERLALVVGGTLIESFSAAGLAVEAFGVAFTVSLPEIALIAAAIAGLALLIMHNWSKVKAVVTLVWAQIVNDLKVPLQDLKAAWNDLWASLKDAGHAIAQAFSSLIDAVNQFLAAFGKQPITLQTFISALGFVVKVGFFPLIAAIKVVTYVMTALAFVIDHLAIGVQVFANLWIGAWNTATTAVKAFATIAADVINTVIAPIDSLIAKIDDLIKKFNSLPFVPNISLPGVPFVPQPGAPSPAPAPTAAPVNPKTQAAVGALTGGIVGFASGTAAAKTEASALDDLAKTAFYANGNIQDLAAAQLFYAEAVANALLETGKLSGPGFSQLRGFAAATGQDFQTLATSANEAVLAISEQVDQGKALQQFFATARQSIATYKAGVVQAFGAITVSSDKATTAMQVSGNETVASFDKAIRSMTDLVTKEGRNLNTIADAAGTKAQALIAFLVGQGPGAAALVQHIADLSDAGIRHQVDLYNKGQGALARFSDQAAKDVGATMESVLGAIEILISKITGQSIPDLQRQIANLQKDSTITPKVNTSQANKALRDLKNTLTSITKDHSYVAQVLIQREAGSATIPSSKKGSSGGGGGIGIGVSVKPTIDTSTFDAELASLKSETERLFAQAYVPKVNTQNVDTAVKEMTNGVKSVATQVTKIPAATLNTSAFLGAISVALTKVAALAAAIRSLPAIGGSGHSGGQVGGRTVFHAGGDVRMHEGGSSPLRHDEVPAVLQRGEFVIRASAAAKIGMPTLTALNRMHDGGRVESEATDVPRFHEGGPVAKATGAALTPLMGQYEQYQRELAFAQGVDRRYGGKLAGLLGVPAREVSFQVGKLPANVAAQTVGQTVILNPNYYGSNPNDVGSIVHELTHVDQHVYGSKVPRWLVEGFADFARDKLGLSSRRSFPDPGQSPIGGYQGTAALLLWLASHSPDKVKLLSQQVSSGSYSSASWEKDFGAPLSELISHKDQGKVPAWARTRPVPGDPGYHLHGSHHAGGVVAGNGDVPAVLQSGEFVIRRSAAAAIGMPTLEAMNRLHEGGRVAAMRQLADVPRFHEGGSSYGVRPVPTDHGHMGLFAASAVSNAQPNAAIKFWDNILGGKYVVAESKGKASVTVRADLSKDKAKKYAGWTDHDLRAIHLNPDVKLGGTFWRRVLEHEMGHAFGLGHVTGAHRLMNPNTGGTHVTSNEIDQIHKLFNPVKHHAGGAIPRGAEVPALLAGGEFVIREAAAAQIGMPTLMAMNQMGGGSEAARPVAAVVGQNADSGGAAKAGDVHLEVHVHGADVSDADAISRAVGREVRRELAAADLLGG